MIESPLVERIVQERVRKALRRSLLTFLEGRFGVLPVDLANQLESVTDENRFDELTRDASVSPDLDTFRSKFLNP